MKYWLLTTEYPPMYGGGISTYAVHTAQMMKSFEHDVTVFIPDSSQQDYKVTKDRISRIVKFNPERHNCSSFLGYTAAMSYSLATVIVELIKTEGKPDVIETQDYLALGYYTLQFKHLLYKELEGVPIVLTLHSPAFLYLHYNREGTYKFPNYWIGEMEKSCLKSADLIISPSEYLIDEVRKHLEIEVSRFRVIRNPYQFSTTDQVNFVKDKIVFYGKLSPQKGVFELFHYFAEMWANGFEKKLIVVGGTEKVYYPEMRTMAQIIKGKYKRYFDMGLFELVGKVAPSEKDRFLQDANVVLIPSVNDNLPYAAIEAMSLGKVVLASKEGGQSELITDRENGFIFSHKNANSFQEKLKEVLSLSVGEIQLIGKCAAKSIENVLNYNTIYYEKKTLLVELIAKNSRLDNFPFIRFADHPQYDNILTKSDETLDLISIVIPYYNMGAYIDDCVNSILNSNYPFKEIIVVNDGSTDKESKEKLNTLSLNTKITILHKKNEGLARTRNFGALRAKGQFLAFLDADDKVAPDYYSRGIAILKRYSNVHFCGSWVQYFGDKSTIWPTWNPEPPYILLHNSVNSSSLIYKKDSFIKFGQNDMLTDYGIEDYESVIAMIASGKRGVVIPEPLFKYRIRQDSMYRKLNYYKLLYSYQYIAQKHSSLWGQYGADLHALLNANGPSFAFDNPSFEVNVTSKQTHQASIRSQLKKVIKKYPRIKAILLKLRSKF